MTLPTEISSDDFAGLGAEQTFYQPGETDGTYVLNGELAEAATKLVDVESITAPLKQVVQRERTAAQEARNKNKALLDKLGDFDVDQLPDVLNELDELRTLKESGLDEARAKLQENFETKFNQDRTRLESKYTGELSQKEQEIERLRGQISNSLLDSALSNAMAETDAFPHIMGPVARGMVKTIEGDDGNWEVAVFDEQGNRRMSSKPGSAEYMGVNELFEELRQTKEYKPGFKSTGTTGGGSKGATKSSAAKGVKNPLLKDSRNLQLATELKRENPALYNRFVDEAASQGVTGFSKA